MFASAIFGERNRSSIRRRDTHSVYPNVRNHRDGVRPEVSRLERHHNLVESLQISPHIERRIYEAPATRNRYFGIHATPRPLKLTYEAEVTLEEYRADPLSGYAYGLQPSDFHAVFEAYLSGRWWLFDATRQANLGAERLQATPHR